MQLIQMFLVRFFMMAIPIAILAFGWWIVLRSNPVLVNHLHQMLGN
jgi:hypothetical protein